MAEGATRVSDIFAAKERPLSFEMFPPKGELALEDARKVAAGLAELAPDFVSVTCSAGGGGNSRNTVAVAAMVQDEFHIPVVAHVTCQGLTRADMDERIATLREAGIVNVLALRGDPQPGAPAGDFEHATDLIPVLAEAGFCVGAAAYPEGHIDCLDLDEDIAHLREKQDAGASFLVTQLFFDNRVCYEFLDRAHEAGVTIPITCGIMPFMGKGQLQRMVFMCGASLPSPIIKLLARYEEDPTALRQAGVGYASDQLRDLAAHGVDGLHLYTMNKPEVAAACVAAVRA